MAPVGIVSMKSGAFQARREHRRMGTRPSIPKPLLLEFPDGFGDPGILRFSTERWMVFYRSGSAT
jgi:hypothetical protein